MALLKREPKVERFDPYSRLDRLFDEWFQLAPFAAMTPRGLGEEVIRVDELLDDGTLVIRAELPGVDPDKDVEISVADHMLCITAERRTEEREEDKGYVRRELRYGSFARTLPLPEGAAEDDVRATYTDGILEIRVPIATQPEPEARKVPISKG